MMLMKITSIWKLRADRAVKLATLSRYVFPGITVITYGEHSGFDALQTPAGLGTLEQLNFPFPWIRSDWKNDKNVAIRQSKEQLSGSNTKSILF